MADDVPRGARVGVEPLSGRDWLAAGPASTSPYPQSDRRERISLYVSAGGSDPARRPVYFSSCLDVVAGCTIAAGPRLVSA